MRANSAVITLDLDHNYVQKTAVLKSGYLSTGAVNNAPASDK